MSPRARKPIVRLKGVSDASRPNVKQHETRELEYSSLTEILTRAKGEVLSEEDVTSLTMVLDTLVTVTRELEHSHGSVKRLQELLFGASTETQRNLRKKLGLEPKEGEGGKGKKDGEDGRKGHGRNAASAYTGARREKVAHTELSAGDRCACCGKGKFYRVEPPNQLVRVVAVAPLEATVYEQEVLRCDRCGRRKVAPLPEGVKPEKYDESVTAAVAVYRYAAGVPFTRLEALSQSWGIPLPETVQWSLVAQDAPGLKPVFEVLVKEAANADTLYLDDTKARVLEPETLPLPEGTRAGERTGLYTTGLLAENGEHKICLFMTGLKHAGENLGEVLKHRAEERDPPLQMCDGLAANLKGSLKTLVCNCLTHGRRRFVNVLRQFPDEVLKILELLGKVYHHDDESRQQGMSKQARLAYHQEKSQPLMEELKSYMEGLLKDKLVEPRSGLGEALTYNLKHWEKMTQFLKLEGAPMDNTAAERLLKKAIRHRRNSLFYKTGAGAQVGDIFMSLIFTAEMNGENPFEYLLALLRHPTEVRASPQAWTPWTWRETLTAQSCAA